MLVWCAGVATAAARPNVVFILADDLGWMDLSCYGSPFCETPNLDQLAKEGARFTQAYTAGAVCSPTRSSIMTGKFPVRTGVTDYIPGLPSTGRKLATPRTKTELALEELTIGEAFRDGGYETFYAGKWHLGNAGYEPSEQGFEHYVSDHELGNHGREWQAGQRLADAAVKFLGTRDSKRPFFAYLAFHEPHIPILEYPEHLKKFQDKAAKLSPTSVPPKPEHDGLGRARQDDAAYASEVAGLDSFVGRVLTALAAHGLQDNTIVVFTSDNGGLAVKDQPGPTCNAPLRAGKGWLYEGGIRVPTIIRAPGVTKAGSVIETPILSTDYYPTLLALAGLPAKPQQHLDGVSFLPALRGETMPTGRTLYWHYPHYHGSTWAPGSALRDGDWKLVENFHYGTVELFNLRDDLGETRDLAKTNPEVTAQLLAKLHAWQKSVNAIIPGPNTESTTAAPAPKKAKKKAK
jgi:arylsulfatase A-like enzyme